MLQSSWERPFLEAEGLVITPVPKKSFTVPENLHLPLIKERLGKALLQRVPHLNTGMQQYLRASIYEKMLLMTYPTQ